MRTLIIIIILLISSIAYSQSISVDYNSVGTVNYRPVIILGFQYDTIPYQLNVYLHNLQTNDLQVIYETQIRTRKWKYKSFNVTTWKTGSYKFIVGFGIDVSREIEFFVWN
ncbi:MAG: hypothetical protein JW917_02585 [Ignavibacteria bacterium]|nr:hypothetical protein [Ignavibacteria bacterium]